MVLCAELTPECQPFQARRRLMAQRLACEPWGADLSGPAAASRAGRPRGDLASAGNGRGRVGGWRCHAGGGAPAVEDGTANAGSCRPSWRNAVCRA